MLMLVGCAKPQPPRNESNWQTLDRHVHPDSSFKSRLTIRELLEESSNAIVYHVDMPLADLTAWYESKFAISIRDDHDVSSGRAGIYFDPDNEFRDSWVFLYDNQVPAARESLRKLLTEKRMATLPQDSGVIGVVDLNDPVEAIRMLQRINETQP